MIGYLRGTVTHIFSNQCYIDVHGVGYRVYISDATRAHLRDGESSQLFTYLNVREDAMQLYGFLSEAEYELFILLISVSGIGPKVGMGILAGMAPEEIRTAIATENVAHLVKLPGIGKKSAERLVLELKDKIGHISLEGATQSLPVSGLKAPMGVKEEVVEALHSLGYREDEVAPMVDELYETYKDVSPLLRAVLGEIGKGR